MKRILYTTIALIFLLAACATPTTFNPMPTKYVHTPYVSTITEEACFVCSESKGIPTALCWGEDNVGILNLNTFELLRITINRYKGGERLQTPAGFMQTRSMQCGNSSVYAVTDPDRGHSHVQIQGQMQPIDAAAIQSHLCQTCLDEINDMHFGNYPPKEYAIVNFADKTVRPLIQHTTFFGSGNYGIDCEFKEDGSIDLWIFYCPPRYK